ncbi:uncharacterized protein LOC115771118 [Drosophila novamexicana]|uniref:uncharacterized protein LOC115771118 n=1 Tax=Drosophila novamexicana TaxID=47314 RepID=UPI0011E5D652|nr:uncharacterized protein LOC115771118 [Drosophila novamexicana]
MEETKIYKFIKSLTERAEKAEDRRRFVFRTFLLFIAFLLLAVLQWIAITALAGNKITALVYSHESALLIVFFMSIMFFLVFAVSSQIRKMACMNWVLTLLVIEGQILAIGLLVVNTNMLRLLIGFLAALIFIVMSSLIAIFVSFDLTKYATLLFLVDFLLLVFCIYTITYFLILHLSWPFFLYAFIVVMLVLPIVMYHVQSVMGNGQERTGLKDDKLSALLLFHDFLALYMLTFYWRPTK